MKNKKENNKEYEELLYNYSLVLDHATNGVLSKTNYDIDMIRNMIDKQQSEFYYLIVKEDIEDLIRKGGDIEDIQHYLDDLI